MYSYRISPGVIYSMVTIINNVICTYKLLRVNLKSSHHKKKIATMYMVMLLDLLVCWEMIRVSNCDVPQYCYICYMSIMSIKKTALSYYWHRKLAHIQCKLCDEFAWL